MANILGVGIATLDIINTVEDYPPENSEVRAVTQRHCRGGNVTNTLSILSQLDNKCTWSGVLCKDYDSQYILDDLIRNKINFGLCENLPDGKMPTSYILLNKKNGSRSIVHYRDIPELSFAHFKTLDLRHYDWIHFEGRNILETRKMIERCKTMVPDTPVSIEIEKPRDDMSNIFNLADLYLYSRVYAVESGYNDAKLFLNYEQKKSPEAKLICAWGEQGAYALVNNNFYKSDAHPPQTIIDTLGAGDTFNAGIIQARLNKLNWQDSLDYANKLAGKKCAQLGFDNLA